MVNLELSNGGRLIVQRSVNGLRIGIAAKSLDAKKDSSAEVLLGPDEFDALAAAGKNLLKQKPQAGEDPNQEKLFP